MAQERAADFDRLEERLVLRGQLVARTALRIGSGGSGELDAADLPVLRDSEGAPFIPGGSLKGAIRSTIEALVRGAGLPTESGIRACDPLLEDESTCGYHKSGDRRKVSTDTHCALCQLFGSRVVASHVRFSDAMLVRSEEERRERIVPVEIRDGVAIDRDLKRVHRGHKYDFEVVSAGSNFALEVFVENPRPWLMGLLAIGFDQLNDGFTAIGGFTSRGLGRVDLKWDGMRRVGARELLENRTGIALDPDAMALEFGRWREALAARAKGGD